MVMNATIHSTTTDRRITAVSVHPGVLLVFTETMITTHGNTVMMMIWHQVLTQVLVLGLAQVLVLDLAQVLVLDMDQALALALVQDLALTLMMTALAHRRLSLERNVSSLLYTRDNITIPAQQRTLETSHGAPHQLEMTTASRIGITASLPPPQAQTDQDLLGLVAQALDLEEALQVVHPAPTLMVTFVIILSIF